MNAAVAETLRCRTCGSGLADVLIVESGDERSVTVTMKSDRVVEGRIGEQEGRPVFGSRPGRRGRTSRPWVVGRRQDGQRAMMSEGLRAWATFDVTTTGAIASCPNCGSKTTIPSKAEWTAATDLTRR